jgi:hypothetical protein
LQEKLQTIRTRPCSKSRTLERYPRESNSVPAAPPPFRRGFADAPHGGEMLRRGRISPFRRTAGSPGAVSGREYEIQHPK